MDKKISLEHAIRNIVRESIGGPNTDEFKGTPKAFLKPAPLIAPKKGDEHPDGSASLSQRGRAKITSSETMKEEEELEEGLKSTAMQAATDVADYGAMAPYAWVGGDKARSFLRGMRSSGTMGAGDYIRAGIDYGVKNIANKVGVGQGTTWEKEKKQEEEKTKKAQEKEPGAYTAGEWTPVAIGAATGGIGLAKSAVGVVKSVPEIAKGIASAAKTPISSTAKGVVAVAKDATKPIGSAAVNLVKGNIKQAGKNFVDYGKQIPSTASGLTKFGAGLEGGLQGLEAIGDKEKRNQMFSPGGGTKFAQDIGKAGVELAAPGSVEAVKKASEGKWKEAGKEAVRAVTGAAVVNPSLSRFGYDVATSYFKPDISLTGEGGVSDRLYDKATKQKKLKENAATIKKIINEKLNEGLSAKAIIGTGKEAEAGTAAIPRAEKALENIWKLFQGGEEGAKGAAKPKPKKPSPDKTEPGREGKPYVDKPANQPGGPNVIPFKAPEYTPPYKPGKDFPNLPPPANPGGKPPIITPNPKMPPPGQDPFRVSPPEKIPGKDVPPPVKPTGPETTPPAPAKPDVKTPAPEVDPRKNPGVVPKELPKTTPAPEVDPRKNPGVVPKELPKTEPWHQPEPRVNPEGALRRLPKEEKPAKKEEPKKEEPPKRKRGFRGVPWLPSFSVNDMIVTGPTGYVPNAPYLHRAADRVSFGESASEERTSIENVARPGGKTRIGKQGQIRTKIIDENVKKASLIKRVIADKKNSIVNLHPKLKNPEADQN